MAIKICVETKILSSADWRKRRPSSLQGRRTHLTSLTAPTMSDHRMRSPSFSPPPSARRAPQERTTQSRRSSDRHYPARTARSSRRSASPTNTHLRGSSHAGPARSSWIHDANMAFMHVDCDDCDHHRRHVQRQLNDPDLQRLREEIDRQVNARNRDQVQTALAPWDDRLREAHDRIADLQSQLAELRGRGRRHSRSPAPARSRSPHRSSRRRSYYPSRSRSSCDSAPRRGRSPSPRRTRSLSPRPWDRRTRAERRNSSSPGTSHVVPMDTDPDPPTTAPLADRIAPIEGRSTNPYDDLTDDDDGPGCVDSTDPTHRAREEDPDGYFWHRPGSRAWKILQEAGMAWSVWPAGHYRYSTVVEYGCTLVVPGNGYPLSQDTYLYPSRCPTLADTNPLSGTNWTREDIARWPKGYPGLPVCPASGPYPLRQQGIARSTPWNLTWWLSSGRGQTDGKPARDKAGHMQIYHPSDAELTHYYYPKEMQHTMDDLKVTGVTDSSIEQLLYLWDDHIRGYRWPTTKEEIDTLARIREEPRKPLCLATRRAMAERAHRPARDYGARDPQAIPQHGLEEAALDSHQQQASTRIRPRHATAAHVPQRPEIPQ